MSSASITVGIISDTHMPERWPELPANFADIFSDVQLILHAGDVGALWVLDQLSEIAPVVAVHGNDETPEATAALPYVQTLSLAGHRLVLTHSHYPDRETEMASRRVDDWGPKLAFRADFGKRHGAKIVISGHTHIAMCLDYDDVLLVNPGALASGNYLSRQTLQSVARMTLAAGESPQVTHIDLHTGEPFMPVVDVAAGFKVAHDRAQETIVDEALQANAYWLRHEVFPIAPERLQAILRREAMRCWMGEREIITAADFVAALRAEPEIPPAVFDKLREVKAFARVM